MFAKKEPNSATVACSFVVRGEKRTWSQNLFFGGEVRGETKPPRKPKTAPNHVF